MARITASVSPIPHTTRLAFLADRVVRILREPDDLSTQDVAVLGEARRLLSSALEGSELITNGKYSVSAGQSFTDLRWTVSALSTMSSTGKVASASGSNDVLSSVSGVLQDLLEHKVVDPEWVQTSALFFRSLRDVLIRTWARPSDRFAIRQQ